MTDLLNDLFVDPQQDRWRCIELRAIIIWQIAHEGIAGYIKVLKVLSADSAASHDQIKPSKLWCKVDRWQDFFQYGLMEFATLRCLEKVPKHMFPNSGLMVIYHSTQVRYHLEPIQIQLQKTNWDVHGTYLLSKLGCNLLRGLTTYLYRG